MKTNKERTGYILKGDNAKAASTEKYLRQHKCKKKYKSGPLDISVGNKFINTLREHGKVTLQESVA